MTQERIAMLASIDFKWAKLSGQALWEQHFNELVDFKKEVR